MHAGRQGNIGITVLVIAALVIGGIIVTGNLGKQSTQETVQPQTQEQVEGRTDTNNAFSARFLNYSEENFKKATANNGRAVIFFHAKWCPLCTEAQKDLQSNFDKVPKDVTFLKTDYDTSEQLKGKYGVVSQDTWVQVDAEGKEITKWNSGGQGLSSLLTNLK